MALKQKRIDVQQLRALAVIAVILNHLASRIFTGGYLGVDAFFVVSGYVITQSIVTEDRPNHSRYRFFVEFWVRRIYRLWPSLFVVVCGTSLLIWMLGVATPSTVLTGVTSLISLSNVRLYFGLQDYFALSTNADWFMHTWSLSVEEQFYIAISVVFATLGLHRVVGANSRSRRALIGGLVLMLVLGAASFAIALLPTLGEIGRFYLPFARFYQLAVGVLISLAERIRATRPDDSADAVYGVRHEWTRRLLTVLAAVLLATVMIVEPSTPRWSSVIVTGLVAVALFAAPPSVRCDGYVPFHILTRIGDRSYALYLVHWPIQLSTELIINNPASQIAASVAGTLIFGETLHHLVENRYRLTYREMSLSRSLTLAAAALSCVLFANGAFFNQLDRRALSAIAPDENDRCAFAWAADDDARAAALISRTWVVGDSHSEAIEPVLARVLANDCVVVARLGPFIVHSRIDSLGHAQRAIRVSLGNPDDLISWITSAVPPPELVIVTHNLTAYLADPSTAPLSSDFVATEWTDSSGTVVTRERFIALFAENLGRVANALESVGGDLVVTSPPPDFSWLTTPLDGINCEDGLVRPRVCFTYKTQAAIDRVDYIERRRDIVLMLDAVSRTQPNVHHIDLSMPFCNESMCTNFRDGAPLYLDDDHLNYRGRQLVEPLLQERLPELVADSPLTGLFIRCTPSTSVFACDSVRISETGIAEANTIDFAVPLVTEFALVDSVSHIDDFGRRYCVKLYENGDGTFSPGSC